MKERGDVDWEDLLYANIIKVESIIDLADKSNADRTTRASIFNLRGIIFGLKAQYIQFSVSSEDNPAHGLIFFTIRNILASLDKKLSAIVKLEPENQVSALLTSGAIILPIIELSSLLANAETRAALNQAQQNFEIARSNLNKQALVEHFSKEAELTKEDQTTWNRIFLGSLVALVGLGIALGYLALIGGPLNIYEHVSIAFPFVWFAWYASRKSIIFSKVLLDYKFKAVMAKTFEAYRHETQAYGGELSQKFAEAVTLTISENPVRLYSGTNSHHSMPAESVLESLADKIAKIAGKP